MDEPGGDRGCDLRLELHKESHSHWWCGPPPAFTRRTTASSSPQVRTLYMSTLVTLYMFCWALELPDLLYGGLKTMPIIAPQIFREYKNLHWYIIEGNGLQLNMPSNRISIFSHLCGSVIQLISAIWPQSRSCCKWNRHVGLGKCKWGRGKGCSRSYYHRNSYTCTTHRIRVTVLLSFLYAQLFLKTNIHWSGLMKLPWDQILR